MPWHPFRTGAVYLRQGFSQGGGHTPIPAHSPRKAQGADSGTPHLLMWTEPVCWGSPSRRPGCGQLASLPSALPKVGRFLTLSMELTGCRQVQGKTRLSERQQCLEDAWEDLLRATLGGQPVHCLEL